MLVKPEFTTHAQETAPIIINPSLQSTSTEQGQMELNKTEGELTNPNPPQIQPISKEELVYKKREFKAFKKLIREGKYTSAIISSKLLGVDKGTILKWIHMPSVLALQQTEINNYVSDIAHSKDWKAKAYLLDKLEDKDNTKDTPITLNNLIQINV